MHLRFRACPHSAETVALPYPNRSVERLGCAKTGIQHGYGYWSAVRYGYSCGAAQFQYGYDAVAVRCTDATGALRYGCITLRVRYATVALRYGCVTLRVRYATGALRYAAVKDLYAQWHQEISRTSYQLS